MKLWLSAVHCARQVAALAERDEGHPCAISHIGNAVMCDSPAGESKSPPCREKLDWFPYEINSPLASLNLHFAVPISGDAMHLGPSTWDLGPSDRIIDLVRPFFAE